MGRDLILKMRKNKTNEYQSFLQGKRHLAGEFGFDPVFMPDSAFPFQRDLIEWAVRKGRAALFADCGMGKTLMQLAWAKNVSIKTGGKVLILTPLAVSHQTVTEAHKFGIDAERSNEGKINSQIVVTNYERLHHFNPDDFCGVVCDESSILKNFAGSTRIAITEFMKHAKYRLLCTATAAPNDYIELGTSSEAIGVMQRKHMLSRFFTHDGGDTSSWRLKGHTRSRLFWEWMASWARAIRKPSDLGYKDGRFILPDLHRRMHVVESPADGEYLFSMPAVGLAEQRSERKRTIQQRCEMAAEISSSHSDPVICWCSLNAEGDLLEKLIPDAIQVSGSDSDELKEEKFSAFETGDARVIVTKPTIAGFGLNWQHCAHQTFFPSHSFEQWYQAIRRSWRFGQDRPVTIDVITSEGEQRVMASIDRKTRQAEQMFSELVSHMGIQSATKHLTININNQPEIIPSWL